MYVGALSAAKISEVGTRAAEPRAKAVLQVSEPRPALALFSGRGAAPHVVSGHRLPPPGQGIAQAGAALVADGLVRVHMRERGRCAHDVIDANPELFEDHLPRQRVVRHIFYRRKFQWAAKDMCVRPGEVADGFRRLSFVF